MYFNRRKFTSLLGKYERDLWHLFRYGVVGLTTNLLGYLVYLAVTGAGVPPKTTVSLLYPVGVAIGFFGNRHFTFKHRGPMASAVLRYLLAHGAGYLLDIGLLYVFVDLMGYPHAVIQAVAIFVVAGFLFIAFRFFVFPAAAETDAQTR